MPRQIVTFTFPHIGNVGANDEDIEDLNPAPARAPSVPSSAPRSPTRPTTARPPISTNG
jgi:carbamoyl-phosphate synthase small subunit